MKLPMTLEARFGIVNAFSQKTEGKLSDKKQIAKIIRKVEATYAEEEACTTTAPDGIMQARRMRDMRAQPIREFDMDQSSIELLRDTLKGMEDKLTAGQVLWAEPLLDAIDFVIKGDPVPSDHYIDHRKG